jgi:two-component system CheB/CheR fusion protein
VVFDEVEESMRPNDGEPADAARELLIGQLEEEIRQLKLHLQDTIESSETSTEELKASNEELQAINEELRSASEELETSKEELQSMNEELVTVNFELKVKVEERGHINDDLQNLIASSEIATVFVSRGMHVKRYTPHAGNLFNLIPSDLGRSLFDITSRLNYPELEEDTASAFKELRTIERHVTSTDGRHFLARILPYRTAEDKIEGAILNFFDITELRAPRTGCAPARSAAAGGGNHPRLRHHHRPTKTAWSPPGTPARSASSATASRKCCSAPRDDLHRRRPGARRARAGNAPRQRNWAAPRTSAGTSARTAAASSAAAS